MGRFCNGLMTAFRIIQLVLSLAALACGAFITYTMLSMSGAAQNIETTLGKIASQDVVEALDLSVSNAEHSLEVLDTLLKPILQYLEGTPTRAIILTAVSFWSICFIIYLVIAQRATHSPRMNKRSIRISLELLTLILWLVGIVCAVLLAIEYGAVVFTGGVELKATWSLLKPVITKALETFLGSESKGESIARELEIVNDIFNIGALSILAVVAACICGIVSFVSLLAACCISGKSKKNSRSDNEAMEHLAPMSTDKPGFFSVTSTPASSATPTPVYHFTTSQAYSPVLQYVSPQHNAEQHWGR